MQPARGHKRTALGGAVGLAQVAVRRQGADLPTLAALESVAPALGVVIGGAVALGRVILAAGPLDRRRRKALGAQHGTVRGDGLGLSLAESSGSQPMRVVIRPAAGVER